jgi:hypothetical protein
VQGYFFSSLVFFFIQFKGKLFTENWVGSKPEVHEQKDQESSRGKELAVIAFISALFGSAFGEICALPFYYPYDLVKVRMQTMHATYGYRNFLDAVIKIKDENMKKINPKKRGIIQELKADLVIPKKIEKPMSWLERLSKVRNFYHGMFYYGLAYTIFISLEFALHDSFMEYFTEFTGDP